MDEQILERFTVYCREHKITFALHEDGVGRFRLDFSAETNEDMEELLKYLRGDADDKENA